MTTCFCKTCESARTGVWPELPSGLYPSGGTPPPCLVNENGACWRAWVAGPNHTGLSGWNRFRGHIERYHPDWPAAYAREEAHLGSDGAASDHWTDPRKDHGRRLSSPSHRLGPALPSGTKSGRSGAETISERVHELLSGTPDDLPVAWKMSPDVLDRLLAEVGCPEAQRRDLMQLPMRLYGINIYIEADLPLNSLMLVSEEILRSTALC
jgi:hypothetical protein